MSVEAMKQALDALEHHGGHLPWNAFVEVRKDLRAAIQQAESEPVGEVHSFGDTGLCDEVQLYNPLPWFTKLYTHPAPGVPDIEAAAKKLAEGMDYPWEHMPEKGRANMRKHAASVLTAAQAQKGQP